MIKCDEGMSHDECELKLLKAFIDSEAQNKSKEKAQNPDIKKMLIIVESFIKKKKLICYGGVSINAVLPENDRIYDYNLEIPDYDFYSTQSLSDVKELADIFAKKGFTEVEAKSGVHHGTYKLYVNFIPIADITYLEEEMFNAIKKEALIIDGLMYCPPNFLRMNMYLELSRPMGDIRRWEKVFKRLKLLDKYYPLETVSCLDVEFERAMNHVFDFNSITEKLIYKLTKSYLIEQKVVFFGSFAVKQYSKYMPKDKKLKMRKIPDFDVLSEDPENVAINLKNLLNSNGIINCNYHVEKGIGENVSLHYQVTVNNDPIVYIYEPLACHSYNVINVQGESIKIATIKTMLSFYLAFLYTNRSYYNKNRILCMARYLFRVQQENKFKYKGLFRTFTMNCYGKQKTLDDMRNEKTKKYRELKNRKKSKEYEEWFLKYTPAEK